jgi:hypothetical protein
MRQLRTLFTALCGLQLSALCVAQPAPGEDPVALNQGIQRTMIPFPIGPQAAPTPYRELPAWMEAKLARFQAKAFAADTSGILTDEDVISRTTQESVRKVCSQDIASNISTPGIGPSNRYGPKPDAQIVVLRGNLVNICR